MSVSFILVGVRAKTKPFSKTHISVFVKTFFKVKHGLRTGMTL